MSNEFEALVLKHLSRGALETYRQKKGIPGFFTPEELEDIREGCFPTSVAQKIAPERFGSVTRPVTPAARIEQPPLEGYDLQAAALWKRYADRAAKMHAEGVSKVEIARRLGTDRRQVALWLKKPLG